MLVGALATGNPQVALLAPFAEKAVAKAFGNSADAMLRRELAAMEKEEERQRFAAQIARPGGAGVQGADRRDDRSVRSAC